MLVIWEASEFTIAMDKRMWSTRTKVLKLKLSTLKSMMSSLVWPCNAQAPPIRSQDVLDLQFCAMHRRQISKNQTEHFLDSRNHLLVLLTEPSKLNQQVTISDSHTLGLSLKVCRAVKTYKTWKSPKFPPVNGLLMTMIFLQLNWETRKANHKWWV